MANTKYSALTVASSIFDSDQWGKNEGGTSKSLTAALLRTYMTGSLTAFSTATVAAGYAVDTYLQGSAVTVTAGTWKAGSMYRLRFDMTKTAAGVAAPVLTLRMGTLGSTGDAAILTWTMAAGTAATDSGLFELWAHFRTVGAGTAAVVVGTFTLQHLTAGITTSGLGITSIVSAGFDSTTQTKIGASFNGGASYSGTTNLVQAEVLNL